MSTAAVLPLRASGVHIADDVPAAAWNDYVARHSAGSVYHRAEWERVFAVYRLPYRRVAAVRGGEITGVLPLVHQRSVLFGSQLVSLPWFDAAGVIADDDESLRSLVGHAARLRESVGARAVQLRQAEPLPIEAAVRTDKVVMRLDLPPEADALWDRLNAKVRNQVRKGSKSGLTLASGGPELLDEFFTVYTTNMRDLGSPSHSRRFFAAVLREFPTAAMVRVVRHEGRAVGAGLTLASGEQLEIPWASSLRPFNSLCVNHFMYWQILAEECRDGYRQFSFGRSTRGSGTWHFKKQWGADERPLHWHFVGPPHDRERAASPHDGDGLGPRVWRRLPVWIARRLGPRLIAHIS